jgi:hypothetical protein
MSRQRMSARLAPGLVPSGHVRNQVPAAFESDTADPRRTSRTAVDELS